MMNQSEAELFLASCGVGTSLRVLVHTPEQGAPREHVFDRPFFIAGRDPRCCLRLDDPDVSRRHAYFQAIDGRLLCVDLASRTGVVWPGGKLGLNGWLAPSCRVQLGPYSLLPAIDRPVCEPAAEAEHERDPLQDEIHRPGWTQATIELSGGNQSKIYRCRVNRMIVLVGRAASCRIRTNHMSVSRFHCSLVWTPLGLWLVDLLSREGTRLNGQPVSCARLADGDEIGVGAYQLRVRYRAEKNGTDQRLPALLDKPVLSGPSANRGLLDPSTWGQTRPEGLLLPVMQQFNLMQQQLCEQFQQTTLTMFRMFTTMHQEQAALVREELRQIQRVSGELQILQGKAAAAEAPEPHSPRPPSNDSAHAVADSAASSAPPAPDRSPLPVANPAEVDAWLNQRMSELQAERQTRWQRLMSYLNGQ